MKLHRSYLKNSDAYTAFELFVVLVTLVLLGLVVVPALARTNRDTKTLQCLNHMRQLAGAVMMYTPDNHELFPPNPDDGNTVPGYNWCAGQAGMGGADEFDPDILKDPQRTLLPNYTKNDVSLFSCPADPRAGRYDGAALYPSSPLIGQSVHAARSVSMSQAVGTIDAAYAYGGGHRGIPNLPTHGPWLTGNYGGNSNTRGPFATFGKSDHFPVIKPADVFLLAEESSFSLNDGTLATCADLNNRRFIDYPSYLHNHGAPFSFCDGHAELHKWHGSAIIYAPATYGRPIRTPGDVADFNWLATHSSVRIY